MTRNKKITIGDITETAGINRGTFYLHYLDKYDLLEKIEQQLFSDLGKHLEQLQTNYLSNESFEENQEQFATNLFHFIEIKSPLFKLLLSERGRASFHYRFRDAFTYNMRENVEKDNHFTANLNVPLEYFLSFITSAFLGLIEQWVQNNLDKTPEEMTQLYKVIITFIQQQK